MREKQMNWILFLLLLLCHQGRGALPSPFQSLLKIKQATNCEMDYALQPHTWNLTFDKDCQEFCITALQLSIPSLACSFSLTEDSLCADFQVNISA